MWNSQPGVRGCEIRELKHLCGGIIVGKVYIQNKGYKVYNELGSEWNTQKDKKETRVNPPFFLLKNITLVRKPDLILLSLCSG